MTREPRTLADLEPSRAGLYAGWGLIVSALVTGAYGLGYTANVDRWTTAEHEWAKAQQMAEQCLASEGW